MAWLLLIAAGILEVVWASLLPTTERFSALSLLVISIVAVKLTAVH